MQEKFPEGLVFINTLYGLAWAEITNSNAANATSKIRGLKEARYAYDQVSDNTNLQQLMPLFSPGMASSTGAGQIIC